MYQKTEIVLTFGDLSMEIYQHISVSRMFEEKSFNGQHQKDGIESSVIEIVYESVIQTYGSVDLPKKFLNRRRSTSMFTSSSFYPIGPVHTRNFASHQCHSRWNSSILKVSDGKTFSVASSI